MAGQGKAQGQIDGVADADAGRNEDLCDGEAIVADLEGRGGPEQVQAVVRGAGESERLAEASGAAGELTGGHFLVRFGGESAIGSHLRESQNGFKGAEEDAAGLALGLAADVHAEVSAIDGVDVGVAGGAEEDAVAWGGAAMGVRRGVGRLVVRAEVSLHLHNAADDGLGAGVRHVHQQLAEQTRGDKFR